MDSPSTLVNPDSNRVLQVDFTWREWKILITEKGDPETKPKYVVDFAFLSMKGPHLIFRHPDESVFGNAILHAISIDSDCQVQGRPIKLEATKRLKTEYTHLSRAFSKTDEPVPMMWRTKCGLKVWDFICLNAQELPVAKYAVNVWATKKVANIEFMGDYSEAEVEEIVVMGTTLVYTMMMRMNNPLQLIGSALHKKSKVDLADETELVQVNHEHHE